ncbi:MAG: LacI family DNA-binding transcriptional regulator [Candidatus Devosia euplotis]|nr:LacI family DNA-binding transcriptional regulator [Candidatus Devosia euplotis]
MRWHANSVQGQSSRPPPLRGRGHHGRCRPSGRRLPGNLSRALSAPDKVSSQTLQRIHDAIARTGYVSNAVAEALASNKSNLIAALVPSVTNIVYASALHAFSEIMWGHGYQIMLSETGFDLDREERAIATHLSRRPDAILLTGKHHSAGARRMLHNAGIPVVEVWDISDTPRGLLRRLRYFGIARPGPPGPDAAIGAGPAAPVGGVLQFRSICPGRADRG